MRLEGWTALAALLAANLIAPALAASGGGAVDTGVPPEPARIDPQLSAAPAGSGPSVVILVLDPEREHEVLADLKAHGEPHHHYARLHQAAAVLSPSRIAELAQQPGVRGLHPNEVMKPLLDKSAAYIGANILWKTYGVRGRQADGTPVGVMIVDTGIDGTHPDVRYGQNLKENVMPTRLGADGGGRLVGGSVEGVVNSDGDGHGTHVASIAAGTAAGGSPDDVGRYRGIANEAVLVGYAAGIVDPATSEATFESVSVLEAFNYALEKKDVYNIRVVSNSWGANGRFDPASPINQASLTLYRAGLVVVFAAGNEGSEGEGSLNKYSVAPWVLSVAGGNYFNQRAGFSSIGSTKHPYDHPDVMAPGVQITAAKAITSLAGLVSSLFDTRTVYYSSKSGTSMAAPHVSGVAGLLIAANPKLSPDEVMDVIVASSTPLPGVPLHQGGAGYLNAVAAYQLARTLRGDLDPFLKGQIKYGGRLVGDLDFSDDPVSVGLGRDVSRAGVLTGLRGAGEFASTLVTTTQGVVFVVGALLLTLASFRFRRSSPP